jgi:hypothetical protein
MIILKFSKNTDIERLKDFLFFVFDECVNKEDMNEDVFVSIIGYIDNLTDIFINYNSTDSLNYLTTVIASVLDIKRINYDKQAYFIINGIDNGHYFRFKDIIVIIDEENVYFNMFNNYIQHREILDKFQKFMIN